MDLWSNANERVLLIPQIFKAGASPSNGLMSYARHSLSEGSLIPQQICSRCILQPQPTGLKLFWELYFPMFTLNSLPLAVESQFGFVLGFERCFSTDLRNFLCLSGWYSLLCIIPLPHLLLLGEPGSVSWAASQQRGKRPQTSALDMTQNNLKLRFQ